MESFPFNRWLAYAATLDAIVAAVAVTGCTHSDTVAAATSNAAAAPHAQLTPQQQEQQIVSAPNEPAALKKVRLQNISGPPMHHP